MLPTDRTFPPDTFDNGFNNAAEFVGLLVVVTTVLLLVQLFPSPLASV